MNRPTPPAKQHKLKTMATQERLIDERIGTSEALRDHPSAGAGVIVPLIAINDPFAISPLV